MGCLRRFLYLTMLTSLLAMGILAFMAGRFFEWPMLVFALPAVVAFDTGLLLRLYWKNKEEAAQVGKTAGIFFVVVYLLGLFSYEVGEAAEVFGDETSKEGDGGENIFMLLIAMGTVAFSISLAIAALAYTGMTR